MRNKSTKGFTLIELMIVVAIIGILAAIAIPNFLRFQLKSKSSEGKVNLAAIRTAEESYLAEYGIYVPATNSPPVPLIGPQKVPFVNTDGANAGFDLLGWTPTGDVFFSYEAVPTPTLTGYTLTARADIDGSGVPQDWGYISPDPLGGTVPGVNGATCPAGGVYNPTSLANDLLGTVGPCGPTYGQSEF